MCAKYIRGSKSVDGTGMKKRRTKKGKKHTKVEKEKIQERWMPATHVSMNGG
jgi:hypothetical protein